MIRGSKCLQQPHWRPLFRCIDQHTSLLHGPSESLSPTKSGKNHFSSLDPSQFLAQKDGCEAALISCSRSQMNSLVVGSISFKIRNSVCCSAKSSVS